MQLSTKDIIPTAVAGIATYIGILAAQGKAFPFIHSLRWMIVALVGIGLFTCITSGLQNPDWKNPMILIATVLGSLAFVVAVIGLIKPSHVMVGLLAWTIVALWAIATTRHIIAK